MKKLMSLFSVVLFSTMFFSCSQAQPKQISTNPKAKLEVFYFHATGRCVTCLAVEENAKKLLEQSFKTQLDNGTIKFASYNVDEDANKALAEKYEITFSTLLLIKSDGTKTDFTDKAFQYAHTNPEKYAELLKAEIEKQLAN
jgi:hypothetical protein